VISAVGIGAWTVEKRRTRGRPKCGRLLEDKPLFYEFNLPFATAANSRATTGASPHPTGGIVFSVVGSGLCLEFERPHNHHQRAIELEVNHG